MHSASRIFFLAGILTLLSANSFARSALVGLPGMPSLTKQDYQALSDTALTLLNGNPPIGATRTWANATSGNHGTIKLLAKSETTYQGKELPCRKLGYQVFVRTRPEPYDVVANRCRLEDGSWKIF